MSIREYAVLYLGKGKASGGAAGGIGANSSGGAGTHRIDGPEHLSPVDGTHLDASTSAHGLLPKLSGDASNAVRGDGTYSDVAAADVPVLDTGDLLTATDVEAALAEIAGEIDAHLTDSSDAHDASAVSFVPAGTIAATNAQAAIEEVATDAGSALSTHAATPHGGGSPSDTHAWMPLTTVIGGTPELVWDADDSLIPTLVSL